MDQHPQSEHAFGRPPDARSIQLMKPNGPMKIPVKFQKPQVEPVNVSPARLARKAKALIGERFKKNCGGLFLGVVLSLSLTLSRWERGQPLYGFVKFVSHAAEFSRGQAETRGVFLPLPAGEGECRPRQNGYIFF
ncbi:MAG TPA: hypothetical protein VK742_00970 [Candidatus Sulfotelmatobacter sp.]|nr:hypothetical protein [Candidatus Sulfotelmatobacter sp.]